MPYYGYSRVTMRDLAHQAGTGLSTAYHHFASKEEIAVILVTRSVEAVHAAMAAFTLNVARSPSYADCLRDMLVARVLKRHEQSKWQRHPVNENTPELGEPLAALRAGWRDKELALLYLVIKYGQGNGTFIDGPPNQFAQTLLWATDSLVAEALLPSRTDVSPSQNMPPAHASPINFASEPFIPEIYIPEQPFVQQSPGQQSPGQKSPGQKLPAYNITPETLRPLETRSYPLETKGLSAEALNAQSAGDLKSSFIKADPADYSKPSQDSKLSQGSEKELSEMSSLADKIEHVANLLVSGLARRSL